MSRSKNNGIDISKLTPKQLNQIASNAYNYNRLSQNAQREDQKDNKKEGVGFTYNHIAHPLGRLFQNTKNIVIEKTIDQIWKNMMRYMCHGDKELYRQALKDPSIAFNFGDTYTGHLHNLMYSMCESEFTDNDWQRKQAITKKMADVACTILFEDIYYRNHSKPCIQMLAEDYNKNPEIYQKSPEEIENSEKWDDFEYKKVNNIPYGQVINK